MLNTKTTTIMFALSTVAVLHACGSAVSDGNGAGGSCRTNVEGCNASAFSCPQAQLCYTSAADCQASGECGGAAQGGGAQGGGAQGGGATNGCRTNVVGCDLNAFSCDPAQLCYGSAADCDASGECD